jgi:hypothetical protein
MKSNEIIKIIALVIMTAALLYLKYGKSLKSEGWGIKKSKTNFSSQSSDDDYEPYSKKNGEK